MEIDTFNTIAQLVRQHASAMGLVAPAFRTPPRDMGMRRAIHRFDDVTAVVAIRLDERGQDEILDDMVEGVIVASRLRSIPAARARLRLISAVAAKVVEAGSRPAKTDAPTDKGGDAPRPATPRRGPAGRGGQSATGGRPRRATGGGTSQVGHAA